jgi:hypothetical protein
MKQWVSAVAPAAAQERAMEEAAEANERTPEGTRYKAAFERTYRELLQKCVVTDGGDVTEWKGKFKTLTVLAANGRVEKFGILSMCPVVTCLTNKMYSFEQENASPFPPPPQGSYWVELKLDWAEFSPVAAE